MPLERKLLSKRHLRQKQAAALNQINFLAPHNSEESNNLHCEQDNSEYIHSNKAQACSEANLNCNTPCTSLFLPSEEENFTTLNPEDLFCKFDSYSHDNVDNLDSHCYPDYRQAHSANMDSFLGADNSKSTNFIITQACTATNSNCDLQHTSLVSIVEQEPASASDHEIPSSENNSDVENNINNLENWVQPDFPKRQPFNINSFLISDLGLHDSDNKGTQIAQSDQSTDDDNEQVRFEQKFQDLRKLACDCNITHTALNRILALIRPKYPFLPKNSKSLLKTKRQINVSDLRNGQMCYIGIEEGLKSKLIGGLINSAKYTNTITIDINIDGLPLYKSSSVNLWPILCRSHSLKNSSPFMVAVFCGKGKPESLDSYLLEFIKEMSFLLQNGIEHNNRRLRIEIGCFLCDAPARAMLKMIKGHTSTFGCEKCCIAAVSLQRKLHYLVDQTTHRKRCDEDYFKKDPDTAHIKGTSPLLRLFVGLVTQFPLDPMHLIYLGVLKRLLINYWIEGPRPCKFSKQMLKIISSEIERLQAYVTAEFNRKPRNLDEVKRWKATEFRFFLVYLGPVILRIVLDSKRYNHFLLLHTAVYILSNETLILRYLDVARLAIEKFVRKSANIYGLEFVVYNVHSLLHLCDDVERYGKLQDFSCFPFENYLGKIKRKIRAKKLPLQQVVKRMSEYAEANKQKTHSPGRRKRFRRVLGHRARMLSNVRH